MRAGEFLFPPRCVFCRKLTDGAKLCPECSASLPRTKGRQRRVKGEFFDFCLAPFYYEEQVRQSLLRFKFRRKGDAYAPEYGRILAQCIGENTDRSFDLVSYVPCSFLRRMRRGYDHSRLLGKATAKSLGSRCVPLLKKKQRPAQSGLRTDAGRRANVLGAFSVRKGAEVEGKHILLIDDIITSGATLSECARVLLMAGAESVVCAVLARRRKDRA